MNPNQKNPNNNSASFPGNRRLPFKSIPLTPSKALRMLLLKISYETGRPVKDVLDDLLVQAAGGKIVVITVKPQCDVGAGVALEKVNEAVEKSYFFLRDAKGAVSHGSFEEQRKTVADIEGKVLELWAHVQSLASKTFFTHEVIEIGRAAFLSESEDLVESKKHEAEELAKKDKGDAKAIERIRRNISKQQALIQMLARLGFSPEGPQLAN